MSCLEAKSNGLIILLLMGFMPLIPVDPVPRTRFIKRVSILSLRLCATAIESYPFFNLISSNQLYLSSRAAICTDNLFFFANDLVSNLVVWNGILLSDAYLRTISSSLSDSLPLREKLQ